ncbi:RraA family protein [Pseudonocardia sp. WMMC193]|uniref:RraA family protein n=1 Tax=Pseudonocardia sp. WMMC193 TaxID=2911965 RepID=UPI001F2C8D63|nr:RraA family protein [Pseudonocardia sp. WMMC193]MCF7549335.1 RraA family protein [Pseudonocardia sp. WMMC193]
MTTATEPGPTTAPGTGRTGALPQTIRPLHPSMHLAARAFPVRTPPGDDLWLHHAVRAASPGEVLVVDCGGALDFGYWGADLTIAAIARGLAGLVIHGGVRDASRLVELGWPIFAATVSTRATTQDPLGDGELGDPIVIGAVPVVLGDLVVGDAAGVVRVPAGRIATLA